MSSCPVSLIFWPFFFASVVVPLPVDLVVVVVDADDADDVCVFCDCFCFAAVGDHTRVFACEHETRPPRWVSLGLTGHFIVLTVRNRKRCRHNCKSCRQTHRRAGFHEVPKAHEIIATVVCSDLCTEGQTDRQRCACTSLQRHQSPPLSNINDANLPVSSCSLTILRRWLGSHPDWNDLNIAGTCLSG